jgi:uncharacterized FlaG/YvyC family protein
MKLTMKELATIVGNYLFEQEEKEEESSASSEDEEKPSSEDQPKIEDKPADNFEFVLDLKGTEKSIRKRLKVTVNRHADKLKVKVTDKSTGDELPVNPEAVSALFYAALKNMKTTDENYKNILAALKDAIENITDKEDDEAIKWLQGRSRHFLFYLKQFQETLKGN